MQISNKKLNFGLLILGIFIDLSLYLVGLTYRLFFYETFLSTFIFRKSFLNILIFFITNLLKFLYIFFSVNIFSLYAFGTQYLFLGLCLLVLLSFFLLEKPKIIGLSVATLAVATILFLDKKAFRDWLASSLIHSTYTTAFTKNAEPINSPTYKKVKSLLEEGPLIFINWESLGVATDNSALDELLLQFPKLEYGLIETEPRSTISSEFEYICNKTYGKLVSNKDCLPLIYKSQYLHGNHGYFFNRKNISSLMGFEKSHFFEDFGSQKNTCFYSFKGVCDEQLFAHALKIAEHTKPHFIYALTLDSHYPYLKYRHHSKEILKEVGSLLNDVKSQGIPYTIFITGDHPPPFSDKFLKNNVPYFIYKYPNRG